jgi:hypothetical protein
MIKRLAVISLLLATAMFAENRVFEMRTYHTLPGKLDALLARFRDHTTALFEKHGITNIGYWVPRDKPNTLVYILAHKDAESAKKSFDAFRQDPAWVKARTESEAAGKIVEKVESVFMDPTDFSKLK